MQKGPRNQKALSSSANSALALSLTAGTAGSGNFGNLRIAYVTVKFSASVSSVLITGTVNSGQGAAFDYLALSETFTGTDFIWFPDFDLQILPKGQLGSVNSASLANDAFDLAVAAGGGVIVSNGIIHYDVLM